ncbi:hypothetical protein [Piscibacillus halophilus]|nr:hypothetical protein [Piscibacillus halophilus]
MKEKDVAANNKTPVIIVALITAVCGLRDAMLFRFDKKSAIN